MGKDLNHCSGLSGGSQHHPVIQDIREHLPAADILVVNDGSTDRTAALAEGLGVKTLSLPYNMGIGAAVQTGFRYAFQKDYAECLQIDGDYQHPAREAPRLLQALREGPADMVIGSRFIQPTGYRGSWLRRMGNRFFQWVNILVVGQNIIDNTSGFRAYSRRAVAILAQTYLGEYPEPESISYLKSQGLRSSEKSRFRCAAGAGGPPPSLPCGVSIIWSASWSRSFPLKNRPGGEP